MTKHKRRKVKAKGKRPSNKQIRELIIAMEMYKDGNIALARQELLRLIQQSPRSKPILLAILEVSEETKDWNTYAYYAERLLPLERGEDQVETRNNLIYAYIELVYPALAWQHSQILAHESKALAPQIVEQAKRFIEAIEPILLQEADDVLDLKEFSREEKFELLILHDRVRFLTISMHPEEAVAVGEQFLAQVPGFIPVLNNASLSQFLMGNSEEAIKLAEDVLVEDPENFHALANLVRFSFLRARFDEAQAYAQTLQTVSNNSPDLEVKQGEAFAFLGDDAQVWAAYERAKEKHTVLSPVLLHCAAVAAYRLDDEKSAWKLWREATKLNPSFDLAQECLEEKKLSVGEREIPWYWPFQYWFPQDIGQVLQKHLGKNVHRMSGKQIERGMRSFVAERPYLIKLFPHMLERGDRQTREFALNMIRMLETQEAAQICYDFAQSHFGSDDIRMEAIQYITENHAAMLPEDKMVSMWVNGKQTELFMLGFEITEEPEGFEGVPDEVLDKNEEVYDLLMARKADAAEPILQEIIAEAPEFYTAYNHLAMVYEMQGRSEEAEALVKDTHARFPDYFFARIGLARMKTRDGEVEEAKELLKPLLIRQKLHISEFRALAQAQMDIALAENQKEGARSWLAMWQQIEPDHPDIAKWESRVENDERTMLQNLINLMKRSDKKGN